MPVLISRSYRRIPGGPLLREKASEKEILCCAKNKNDYVFTFKTKCAELSKKLGKKHYAGNCKSGMRSTVAHSTRPRKFGARLVQLAMPFAIRRNPRRAVQQRLLFLLYR